MLGEQIRGGGDLLAMRLYASLERVKLRMAHQRPTQVRAAQVGGDSRWILDSPSPLEMNISLRLNEALGSDTPSTYVFEGIERLLKAWSELQLVSSYMKKPESSK